MKRSFKLYGILTKEIGQNLFWYKSLLTNSQQHSYLASGSSETTIKIWNTTTCECIKTFDCQSRVRCLAFVPNRPDELVSGLGNGDILIWHIKLRELLRKFKGLIKK